MQPYFQVGDRVRYKEGSHSGPTWEFLNGITGTIVQTDGGMVWVVPDDKGLPEQRWSVGGISCYYSYAKTVELFDHKEVTAEETHNVFAFRKLLI